MSQRVPRPTTSFIGRTDELARLLELVGEAGLVTVVGPGGAGKTRLVLEWAREAAGDVVFCDLSDATSAEAMCIAVSQALGVPRAAEDQLGQAIADRAGLVLILDNLEQIASEVAALVDAWLAGAERARIIVTSRAPLHLDAEQLLEISALALPGAEAPEEAAACLLFLDRARALRSDFEPGPADWGHIAEIVTRLDGLPLAIELAASRMRVLSPQQIAAQLGAKLDLFQTPVASRPARHATLRGVVDWSWQLLEDGERTALCRWSVFPGTFDLDAAEAVLGGGSAVAALQALRDHALLKAVPSAGGLRYRLLECVRDFAAELLSSGDHAHVVVARFDAYFDRIAAEGSAERIAGAIDELLLVHRSAVEAEVGPRALRIALALEPELLARGPAKLLLRILDEALALDGVDRALVARGLLARGHALADLGRFEDAQAAREEALEAARDAGDRRQEGLCQASLGRHAWHMGRVEAALAHSDAAMELLTEAGDEASAARTRSHRANFRWVRGELEDARQDYLAALEVLERHDDRRETAIALGNLANLEQDMGFIEDARRRYEEAIAMLADLGDRIHQSSFAMNLGGLLFEIGELDAAREAYLSSLALQRTVGNRRWEGVTLASLARCDEVRGQLDEALAGYVEATHLSERFGHPVMLAMVLSWRARFAADRDDVLEAERWLERAETTLAPIGDNVVQGLVEVARAHLELARARATGAAEHLAAARAIAAALRRDVDRSAGEVRVALRRLERVIATLADAASPLPDEAWVVSDEGRRFRPPGGPWQDLSTRAALRRMLDALALRRASAPGEPLTRSEMLAAGWPNEHVMTEAGASRVYTAVATLRRRGLRDVLLRRDDGYLLDPDVPFIRR